MPQGLYHFTELSMCFIPASRNWRYEQELASLLWKVDFKDVVCRDQVALLSNMANGTAGQPITRVGLTRYQPISTKQ